MLILPLSSAAIIPALLALALSVFTEEKHASLLQKDKEALAPLQKLVGQWRGAGFRRRGSTRGAGKKTPPGPGNSAKAGRPWFLTPPGAGT